MPAKKAIKAKLPPRWTGPKREPGPIPCPLCGTEMSGMLEIYTGFHLCTNYARVAFKLTCSNENCNYEERTKGETSDSATIIDLQKRCLAYRGADLHKQGKFTKGRVGVNRRRHVGPYDFIAVEPNQAKPRR